ncbi:plastid division protein PDV1-like [Magnolia sinica]|uniref:plastid division protein PDV1-like n=1 Tax=Magnolia sinica TaxID=86752 RepID=UPI002659949E|nr:plastid division protein PDV1-like [Magnolia sinica]
MGGMEVEENLESLIERAWALHDKISDEIYISCIEFRKFHPQHVPYGGFAESSSAETKSLTAIREALQVLENMLLCLQRLQSQQRTERDTALMRLEESRSSLLERIAEHHGRTLDVIEDLLAFVMNKNTIWDSKNPIKEKTNVTLQDGCSIHATENRIVAFLKSCLQFLSYPLKLKKAAGMAGRLAVVVAGMVSVIHLYQTRQHHMIRRKETMHRVKSSYGRHEHSLMKSTVLGQMGFIENTPNSHLDVFYGRG